MNNIEQMLTVQELSELLQVSYKTALKEMKLSIPYIRVSGKYRMRPQDVARYMNPESKMAKVPTRQIRSR